MTRRWGGSASSVVWWALQGGENRDSLYKMGTEGYTLGSLMDGSVFIYIQIKEAGVGKGEVLSKTGQGVGL